MATKKESGAFRSASAQVASTSTTPQQPVTTVKGTEGAPLPPPVGGPVKPDESASMGPVFNTFPIVDVPAVRVDSRFDITDKEPMANNVSQPAVEIELDIGINNFKPIETKGLSEQRPEIVAQFNFEPAYDSESVASNASLGPVAEMLDIQASARQLRAENIVRLLNELKKDADAAKIIDQLEKKLIRNEDAAEKEAVFLQQMVKQLSDARRTFSIKSNIEKIRDDIKLRDKNVADDPVLDVMVNVLGFSEKGYRAFSDTKILGQMLDDLRGILRSYSSNLIQRVDRDRAVDMSSFDIIRTADATVGANNSFDVSSLMSKKSDEIASILDESCIYSFLNVIRPLTDFDDRFKLLIAVLSREIRASAGLSTHTVQNALTQTFKVSTSQFEDGVFDRIIGSMGRTVFDPVITPIDESFVRFLRVDSGDIHVLPFESSIVRKLADPTLPGRKFYVDSIVKGRQKFNVKPYVEYATSFGRSAQSLATIVEGMLDVNVIDKSSLGLNASDIMNKFLSTIKTAIDSISSRPLGAVKFQYDESPPLTRDTFTPALLCAAADDPLMKYMLVLYVALVGVGETQQRRGLKNIFNTLVDSADLNAGTGVSKGVDLTAGLRRAVAKIAQKLVFEAGNFDYEAEVFDPMIDSAYAQSVADLLKQNRGLDLTGIDFVADAESFMISGLDVLSAMIVARLLKFQGRANRPTGFTPHSGQGPRRRESFNDREKKAGRSRQSARSIDIDDVADDRIFDKLASVGNGDTTFLLRDIVGFINHIDYAARSANPGSAFLSIVPSYFSEATPGLTRYGKLGVHTIIMMAVELFTSFFKAFPIATFNGADLDDRLGAAYGRVFGVQRNDSLVIELKEALNQLVPGQGLNQSRSTVYANEESRSRAVAIQSIVDRFSTMRKKMDREDDVVRKITNVILAIGNNLKQESQSLSKFFDPLGQNAQLLQSVINSPGADEKLAAIDAAQISLSRNALLEHKVARQSAALSIDDSSAVAPFVDDTVMTVNVRRALDVMLKSSKYLSPNASNLRLISVGLPAGFQESLYERVSTYTLGQDFVEFSRRTKIQNDVIRVHVYMKDLLFDDIVFKPQSFIFEMGRFVGATDFNDVPLDNTKSFESLLATSLRSRVLTNDDVVFKTEIGVETADDPSYETVVASNEKSQLLRNHVESYLLGSYVRLLTGINLSEDCYYVSDSIDELRVDDESRALFIKLLDNRLTKFAGRKLTLQELRDSNESVNELLQRIESTDGLGSSIIALGKVLDDATKAVNIEIADDLLTFLKMFGANSTLFGAGARRQRLVAPRLFERIFNIAFDPDDFEIDVAATSSTTAGRTFLDSTIANRLLQTTPTAQKIVQRDMNNVALGDYRQLKVDASVRREIGQLTLQQFFVVVEQLPQLSSVLHAQETSKPRGSNIVERKKNLKDPDQSQSNRPESRVQSSASATKDVYDATPKNNDGIEWGRVI